MDCYYLNWIWSRRWWVATVWTHTYVFCIVRVRLLVAAQSVYPLRSEMDGLRSANRWPLQHCTARNTRFDPFSVTKMFILKNPFTLPRFSKYVRSDEVNGCNWHREAFTIIVLWFFSEGDFHRLARFVDGYIYIYICVMRMLIVTKYVWIWWNKCMWSGFLGDLLNYAYCVSIVGCAFVCAMWSLPKHCVWQSHYHIN